MPGIKELALLGILTPFPSRDCSIKIFRAVAMVNTEIWQLRNNIRFNNDSKVNSIKATESIVKYKIKQMKDDFEIRACEVDEE